MAHYTIQIHLTDSPRAPAKDAHIVDLLEGETSYAERLAWGDAGPREEVRLHFAHHTFRVEGRDIVDGKATYYGGMGEGSSFDTWREAIHVSLYDLHQTSDVLKDGDTLEVTYLGEKVEFVVRGVHVLPR